MQERANTNAENRSTRTDRMNSATQEPRIGDREVDGLRIRFAEGGGSVSQHIVLTSP